MTRRGAYRWMQQAMRRPGGSGGSAVADRRRHGWPSVLKNEAFSTKRNPEIPHL